MRLPYLLLHIGAVAHALAIHGGRPTTAIFGPPYIPPPYIPPPYIPYPPHAKNFSVNGKSETWAGAWIQAPDVQTFTSVTSQFQVLEPQLPLRPSNHTTYVAAEWVGLADQGGLGTRGAGVIVQAGIILRASHGVSTVGAWWQWFPDDEQEVHLPISWGDVLTITITMTGLTTAHITVRNETKNKDVKFSIVDGQAAALQYACFIVEDVEDSPLLHFADVAFVGCRASAGSTQYGFDASSGVVNMVDIDGSGRTKASAIISDSSTTVVRYVPREGEL
jgi:Peptidase A4 family